MDPVVTAPVPPTVVATQPPKGVLGFIKQHKWIVLAVLAVVLYFVHQKWSKRNNPPAQQAVQLIQPVQVPPPPAAMDPNFTRLTPATTTTA
jgi:hypothetical protein